MNIFELLSHLRSMDIKLFADAGKLRYSDPKGAMTDDLRSKIIERKTEILDLLHQADLATHSIFSTISTVPRDRNLPLSFAQQRLWFLDKFYPQSSMYNISRVLRMKGFLNVNALKKALESIVERHESIRTTFSSIGGVPRQLIAAKRSVDLPIVDMNKLQASKREEVALRLIKEETTRPFNLSEDLMLRGRLLKMDSDDHIFIFVMHHIASDGWSMGILFRELVVLYEAFSTGRTASLPELPIQYADFAVWQRKWLQGNVLKEQLSYWEDQLADAPPVLELPTDHARPPVKTYVGNSLPISFPATLADGLKALGTQQKATPFMALLAAFDILLGRYSGQEDIVVGTPIANRNRMEIEGIIGFFVNTLVLRTDLSGDPTFRELLERVRKLALQSYNHQDLPFEKLVEELEPERKLSHSTIFQVMFVFQNTPRRDLEMYGLSIVPIRIGTTVSKFDLTLSISETDQELDGFINYNTDLFEEPTITRMIGHFQSLLESIVKYPDKKISELPLLTDAERHQLLVDWNDTKADFPEDVCIHELFEAQAELMPDATAVIFEGERLTYSELNARANQLAHYLRNCGVGPEILVGIFARRSLEMIVGILGVLKAGGAYVPLDPDYPAERTAYMLEDPEMPVLLTLEKLLDRLPENIRTRVICLDSEWGKISQESKDKPISGVKPENLVYVLYTSGSTGKPKGVAVEHRQVVNYTLGVMECLEFESGGSFAMVQPLTVDSSVTVIFSSLCSGGSLHLISREKSLDFRALGDYFHNHAIDYLKIAPSHLLALHSSPDHEKIMPLKGLVIGGEASRWEWVQGLRSLAPECKIFNHYGPTETTVGVIVRKIWEKESHGKYYMTPLGRPIANTQIYILDRHLQPVPVGIRGELYIGGNNVVRGYLNRPELTAGSFIPDPFSSDTNARLYKTGDVARYLPDGDIEFLGRSDYQVKIRGFRVELGEIEAAVSQYEGVQEALAMVREDGPDDKRLVAYVVPQRGQSIEIAQLRSSLKKKLPDHMVPAVFVIMDAMPLTPHGKIDRNALPDPGQGVSDTGKSYVAPRTPVEEKLAEMWSELLHLDRVSIHDNFFDLGGHSLLSIQVISRIRQAFQVEIPVWALFEVPTVSGLAEAISQKMAEIAEDEETIRMMDILEDDIKESDEKIK